MGSRVRSLDWSGNGDCQALAIVKLGNERKKKLCNEKKKKKAPAESSSLPEVIYAPESGPSVQQQGPLAVAAQDNDDEPKVVVAVLGEWDGILIIIVVSDPRNHILNYFTLFLHLLHHLLLHL